MPRRICEELGQEILAVVSDLSGRRLREILTSDLKESPIDDTQFAVGFMETVHWPRLARQHRARA